MGGGKLGSLRKSGFQCRGVVPPCKPWPFSQLSGALGVVTSSKPLVWHTWGMFRWIFRKSPLSGASDVIFGKVPRAMTYPNRKNPNGRGGRSPLGLPWLFMAPPPPPTPLAIPDGRIFHTLKTSCFAHAAPLGGMGDHGWHISVLTNSKKFKIASRF